MASSKSSKSTSTVVETPSSSSPPPSKPSWVYPATVVLPLLAFAFFKLQSNPSLLGGLASSQKLHEQPRSSPSSVASGSSTEDTFETMRRQYGVACPEHNYQTHIFSTDPLIIYVENYLSYEETRYILDLAKPLYMQSPVSKGHTLQAYDKSIRSSQSAVLPDDNVISCIEQRSIEFQGYQPLQNLEDLQVVKYEVGDQFRPHFDWFSGMENPRISTIFAYLECDNCEGGATQFPHFGGRFSSRWCGFIDCEQIEDEVEVGGIGFKPLVGNAVFWSNLYANGTGHPGVWHAGMPVRKGSKYGLNIFTRRDAHP